jgi:hypothetical protein
MESALAQTMTEFGAFGVLCLFAYILLKASLKQSEKLGELLSNHLASLLEHQQVTNSVLKSICDEQERQSKTLKDISEKVENLR